MLIYPTVVLETKDRVFTYSVFSVMRVKSIYDIAITPVYDQQILTLSTCCGYNQNDRILVLAVHN